MRTPNQTSGIDRSPGIATSASGSVAPQIGFLDILEGIGRAAQGALNSVLK